MYKNIFKSVFLIASFIFSSSQLSAQQILPDSLDGVIYRGSEASVARGVIDGNLIETNFRNHGEISRWGDIPWGIWPRGQGGRHIDGVGVVVSAYVDGVYSNRVNSLQDYIDIVDDPNFSLNPDTTLNPVLINYRTFGKRNSPYTGVLWGWLPIPGFHNPLRTDPITGASTPVPALSNDRNSWPKFWPDRLNVADDPGWQGTWNGRDGRLPNADLESYYIMDDFSDLEYAWGQEDLSSEPGFQEGAHSSLGVYFPSPHEDPTQGGLGLQTQIRLFQWANILAEDVMFIIYRVFNRSESDQERLFFSQIVDYGLGSEEDDDNATYDPFLDLVFGWDADGIGEPTNAGDTQYELGYTGFAFLESPANDENMVDDDLDGITDESRFDNNYMLFTNQADILAYTSSEYDVNQFEIFYGETIEERPAYAAGRWFTTDENLDWVGFIDNNNNGIWDSGELLNSDIGLDGLGPFDLDYEGPDFGEGDGIPNSTINESEPNYNTLDVDESDQIGLTGFDLNTRPFYEAGRNLLDDTWLFARIELTLFSNPEYVEPSSVADDEPFILFTSGEVELFADNNIEGRKSSDFFSTAWIFGENEADFFKNRRTVQSIYNSDYNFAQPPITPTFTAVVTGDNQVQLAWDTLSVRSFDRFLQEFDFEGYKLYKGTNNILTDARTITDINGTATFYKPIEQWDLAENIDGTENTFQGPIPVLEGDAVYDLGSNTGLEFFYLDNDVTNGKRYFYAIVAYDRGVPAAEGEDFGLDPQENVFRIAVDIAGNVTGTSQNAAVVTPTTYAAGYQEGGSTVDLSSVTTGSGTGYATLNIISDALVVEDNVYQVSFASNDSLGSYFRETISYSIRELSNDSAYITNSEYTGSTSFIDGFTLNFTNPDSATIIPNRTGWVSNEGQENELFNNDPTTLDGFTTDWEVSVAADYNLNRTNFVTTDHDYEMYFVNPDDSTYQPPFLFGTDFSFFTIPVFARNLTTNELTNIFVLDEDDSGDLSGGDVLFIAETDERGRNKYRYTITFFAGGTNTPPSPGDKIRISTTRQFGEDDVFQFGVRKGAIDKDDAKSDLEDIFVAPNPYIGAASWERAGDAIGRGERKIIFFNLPTQCTIRIFNIRGELIKTIEHTGAINKGSVDWDLKTNNNEDVAYGVYFYHVEAPGIGEFKDKFAIIK